MQSSVDHVEEVYRRTFGSSSFTHAPHRLDRAVLENERAQQERARRYGHQESPSMAWYRAMKPDATVAQLQELEREIWALGRAKRRMDAADFVKRLAQSSMAHRARVAGRSRRHTRNQAASALFSDGEADAERDALLLEEELEKLDDGLWDRKVKQRAGRQSSDRTQADRKRWHHERLEYQMIRDERSDPAFRRPQVTAWEDRPRDHQANQPAGSRSTPTELHQQSHAGPYSSNEWVGAVDAGAHWVGSEPSAQAELLALRHSIEVQQLHAEQLLQELQARQIVEGELEWQLLQRQEQRAGFISTRTNTPDLHGHVADGGAGLGWPKLPFDDEDAEPYPLDYF